MQPETGAPHVLQPFLQMQCGDPVITEVLLPERDRLGRLQGEQALPWEKVPSGMTVCIKTMSQRIGIILFDWEPGLDEKAGKVTVSGTVWRPTK
ncbi:hypothetical protein [Nocardia sp. SYP-A9097]|uniref:hypothetical protein n=1 Tax=Nocardia sp. SYP-A9097 TaxID=2663237 RepID=UPI001E4902F9|nr:hypothetical protein [Nocardia sp. SYP-A9097]